MNIQTPPEQAFRFDNSFARSLDGFFVPWKAAEAPKPQMLAFNHALAEELGLDTAALDGEAGAAIFSGNVKPEGAEPLAQAYAGHQFGGFSPQLGDGRALLLGEVIDRHGRRRDIQLKGSGRTPFSRNGDGKAALGPVLREYLIGEAMQALGVPTTRALAAVATGDLVYRETPLPGAVLTRVSASHLRVGTFQFFAARGEVERVRQLTDYAIDRHCPEARDAENPPLAFLEAVIDAQAALVAKWMHLGFIHGVMNTDNMTISGETIDYGPCAFMDAYAPGTFFSSIDTGGRYAYGAQPPVAQWNLARLAETLVPLVDDDQDKAVEKLIAAVNGFTERYDGYWLAGMRGKIGLETAEDGDLDLLLALFAAMEAAGADFTLTFRRLADAAEGEDGKLLAEFDDPTAIAAWLADWRRRLEAEPTGPAERAAAMRRQNPIYIPRNHKVEEALASAAGDDGGFDMTAFNALLGVLTTPFEERDGFEDYANPPPEADESYRTFCGT